MSSHSHPLLRFAVLLYGFVSYAIFLATFLYAIGFVGDFLVPRSIDSVPVRDTWTALMIDIVLLGLFALQHSVMARPWFKRALTRYLPEPAERSTYVLMSSLALILMFWRWEPIGGVIWNVESPLGRVLLHSGFAFGWLTVLVTTFLINHFDLFGLRQVWKFFRRQRYVSLKFVTPGPYKLVRHPLYVGWLFAFWCTPHMTAAHLVFAVLTTAYILVAIQFEERDLIAHHGSDYTEYRRRTPMMVPRLSRPEAEPSRQL
ncbi:methanethiol S-methyltransferase [Opitutus terrae]|nr:methanethiol S-methyltransferase [Opitutus terrae]